MSAGAEGAKLYAALRDALHDLREMPFQFEDQGSRVIYYNDEN